MTSVNTNYGALVALQSLTQTTRELAEVQNRVNTGLKVASAKDNGAVFAIAEGQRARVASLGAVQDGIDRATSVIDVGLSAGEAIGDILKQLKEKAVAGQANDLSQDQRDALQADFLALRNQIDQIANAATFNGSNLANGSNLTSGSAAFSVLTSDISSATPHSVTGAALAGTPTLATTLATATGLTFDAGDHLDFTITNGSTTTTHTINLASYAGTVQDFLDLVATETNGEVSATFDETAGTLSFSSNQAFAVQFYDVAGTGTAKSDLARFDGGATTTGGTLSGGSAGSASSLTVSGFDFRLGKSGQALAGLTSTLDISSAAGADTASSAIDDALTALNKDLATLGAQSKALDVQKKFLGKLSDSIEAGIGNLVDADLAKESARLQALQVKQQLGAQALSIANSAPSIVLSFFR
jgi:flagellin